MIYYYDSNFIGDVQERIISKLKDREDVEIIDTADWSSEDKNKLYYKKLIKLRIKQKKPLRKKLKTDKSGTVLYSNGILVKHDDFFAGEDVLKRLENTKSR